MADTDREALAAPTLGQIADLAAEIREAVPDIRALRPAMDEQEADIRIAKAVLSRWRLVPVDSEPAHVHNWEEVSSAEQIENGAHIFYCAGYYGCGKNDIQFDRA